MRFAAVLRASSQAKVRRTDLPIVLERSPSLVGPLEIVIRTRYDEKEFGVAVPRELWFDVRGDSDSLEEGLNASWAAANSITPFIALAANAAIGEVVPHLAFETTQGAQERAFFQSTIDTERGLPRPGRRVPTAATIAMLQAIGDSDHQTAARLMRAANQYLLALRYWKRHHELLCVSHLFMAAEALKVIALRQVLSEAGLSEADLAREWDVRPDEPRTRQLLEAAARRRLVFHQDVGTEKRAAEVSNGFEHGFRDLGEFHGPSLEIRDLTARHVRRAFLELASVSPATRADLISGNYEDPLDETAYVRYMRGWLIGPGDELAATDEEYPYLEWTSTPTVTAAGEGKLTISGTENFTVRTADTSGFRAGSFEFWGPKMDPMDTDPQRAPADRR